MLHRETALRGIEASADRLLLCAEGLENQGIPPLTQASVGDELRRALWCLLWGETSLPLTRPYRNRLWDCWHMALPFHPNNFATQAASAQREHTSPVSVWLTPLPRATAGATCEHIWDTFQKGRFHPMHSKNKSFPFCHRCPPGNAGSTQKD